MAGPASTGSPGTTGAGGNGTRSGAGGHSTGYNPAMMKARELVNWQVATNYATFLSSLIGFFILLHWARLGFTKYQRSKGKSPASPGLVAKPFVWLSRGIRNLLVRKAPGFYSSGHGLLTAIYVAANVAFLFTNLDFRSYGNVAARCGWMLSCNLLFVIFLALKNTPLAILTSYSYERLNNLHQIAGCTTFVLLVLHGGLYTAQFWNLNKLEKLREHEQVAGIISAFSFLSMVGAALVLRRYWYELFYVVHIAGFIAAIISIGFHRPEFPHKTPILACLAGAMWLTDRLIRMTRLSVHGVNNEATVIPLASGGTRVILAKTPARAVPGKHCFVWLPSVRRFETHPFTIIDTDPMEFVVKTYDGFTRDLHKFAVANPGARIRASVDGPYGTFPDPMLYDRVVLIAGGSGASFTFGLAVNLLERMGPESTKSIVFIWVVRKHENLTWYAEHLRTLHDHPNSPKCKVSLYATRAPPGSASSDEEVTRPRLRTGGNNAAASDSSSERSPTAQSPDIEKIIRDLPPSRPAPAAAAKTDNVDDEKREIQEVHSERPGDSEDDEVAAVSPTRVVARDAEADAASASSSPLQHVVTPGRPDAETLIRNAVSETPKNQRVLIAACGPPSLMKVARNTTAQCIRGDGPGVELHCEQFGW